MHLLRPVLLFSVALTLPAATHETLSLAELVQKSAAVVRGRANGSRTAARGPVIYTHYQVHVVEQWKGPAAIQVEVSVPGGAQNGVRQTFSGAPKIQEGVEYVLFLWKGRNGLNQVIGLSQGKFELSKDGKGAPIVHRTASSEQMLDAKGKSVDDEVIHMTLESLDRVIRRTLRATTQ